MGNREHSGTKERSEKFDIDNVRLENLAKGRRICLEQILSGKITRKNPMERFMKANVPVTSNRDKAKGLVPAQNNKEQII